MARVGLTCLRQPLHVIKLPQLLDFRRRANTRRIFALLQINHGTGVRFRHYDNRIAKLRGTCRGECVGLW